MPVTKEDLTEYQQIREGLQKQANRLVQADAIRDAARRETGVLLRRAAELGARCPDLTVTVTDAADLTCLPEAAFTVALADVPADGGSRHYVGMTDADLAAATLQGYDSAESHLGLRFPHVAALRDAARVLTTQHEATRPQAPLGAWLDWPPAPGAVELAVLYRAHVEAIAAGRPVTRVEDLQGTVAGHAPGTD